MSALATVVDQPHGMGYNRASRRDRVGERAAFDALRNFALFPVFLPVPMGKNLRAEQALSTDGHTLRSKASGGANNCT